MCFSSNNYLVLLDSDGRVRFDSHTFGCFTFQHQVHGVSVVKNNADKQAEDSKSSVAATATEKVKILCAEFQVLDDNGEVVALQKPDGKVYARNKVAPVGLVLVQ